MSKYTTISPLPEISNFEIIKNLDVNKRYIIDPKGLNIPIAIAKFTKIRELYTLKVMSGEDIRNIVLDIRLNRGGRFLLHSISMVKGKFIMRILDYERDEYTFCDFEKDILRVYSEDYSEHMRLNQKKKYNLKKSKNCHENKKRPDSYQKERQSDWGRAKYAFEKHDDIKLILSFKEKYPNSRAFAGKIAEYNAKQKSQSETPKDSTIYISAEEQQYIKRLVQIFSNIKTDETTFSVIITDYLKNKILKSRVDVNEVEKMKNEISEMENEISEKEIKISKMENEISEMKNENSEKKIKISTMNKVLSYFA